MTNTIKILEGKADSYHPIDMDKYALQKGLLYYVHNNDHNSEDPVRLRLMMPKPLKQEALILSHDTTLEGNSRARKTLYNVHSKTELLLAQSDC